MEKLSRESFNAAVFAKELSIAYDLLQLQRAANQTSSFLSGECYLMDIYEILTPMRRFKRDFDARAFAYAIARLHASDVVSIDDGRHFSMGPSRNNRRAIRILDRHGKEEMIATIRFYHV